jgi:hypothetical protein
MPARSQSANESASEGHFDVAVLRHPIQVLGPDAASRALRNVGEVIDPGGWPFTIDHVLDSRLARAAAACLNLTLLSVYDEGQSYTEREHRTWLAEAGFANIDVHYSGAPAEQASSLRAKQHISTESATGTKLPTSALEQFVRYPR